MMGKAKIEGYCHEDYEPVKKQFEHMIKKGIEENAQLCVYVGGDCVIDLYGSAKGEEEFNGDKITVCQFKIDSLTLSFCPNFNFVQFSVLSNFQFCPIFNFVQFSILSNF